MVKSRFFSPASLGRWLFDQPYLLLSLAMLLWAGGLIVGRAVRLAVPPIGLTFWRWFGAALILSVFALPHVRQDWTQIRARWPFLLLLAVLGVAILNILIYTGLRLTTAINGLLIQSTTPVMIVIMTYLLFQERPTRGQIQGLILSLAGVLIIIFQGRLAFLLTLTFNLGDLLILVAVVSYAAYSALLRRSPLLHPLSFLFVIFGLGVLVLAPFYLWENLTGLVTHADFTTFLTVAYVALFASVLAYLAFNRGVEMVGANRASPFFHLIPLFGTILAILFLGERFQLFHALGIGLIIGGILLATRQ